MPDEIKKLFSDLSEDYFSDKNLEKALQKARKNDQFRKLNYGKFKVLVCGDHNGSEINLNFLKQFNNPKNPPAFRRWSLFCGFFPLTGN